MVLRRFVKLFRRHNRRTKHIRTNIIPPFPFSKKLKRVQKSETQHSRCSITFPPNSNGLAVLLFPLFSFGSVLSRIGIMTYVFEMLHGLWTCFVHAGHTLFERDSFCIFCEGSVWTVSVSYSEQLLAI